MTKKALVLGAGGFIAHHLVKQLKREDFFVIGADLVVPAYEKSDADEFYKCDLRDPNSFKYFSKDFDEIYQLAADMGGAGYLFTGLNDAQIMHNSSLINLNLLHYVSQCPRGQRVFFSSSACVYPEFNQLSASNPICSEDTVYPAQPDSEYGWEKLFSERMYLAYARNYGVNSRLARYHNIYGPLGSWNNGKEKAPAALCRKIASASNGGSIEIWGDGNQTRSFLYVQDCIEATTSLLRSNVNVPLNVGSDVLISINQLVDLIAGIAGKTIRKVHVEGPLGVRGRVSDNRLILENLNWSPRVDLQEGLALTYEWVETQLKKGL